MAIALSGFCALAAQVIWTRLLSLLFGASTYTFSLILAVFLIGLGIGSSLGSIIAKSVERPRVALGWCQLLNVGAMAWSAYMLLESLPYWPINTSITSSIWYNFQLDFVRAFWAVLPGPILWGASFPLALAAVARKGEDPGRLVGGVYAANTVGAIFGSVIASLILVYWFGSQRAQQVLMIVSGLAGLLLLAPAEFSSTPSRRTLRLVAPIALILALGIAAFLIRTVPKIPGILVAYGRYAATWIGQEGDIFYVGEGLSSSVAVSRFSAGIMNYHNAGKVQASSQPQDMRLQRMLGHFTTLVPKSPKKVLVIGCGAGATAGAVSIDQNVESLIIAEIEPLVPRVVSEHFGEHNFNVVRNPKTHVVIDDARHFLVTTDEKFDAITSDPLDPWVKGAATLYTKEFFELAKSKLNPGGTVTLFVQLYESTPEAVKSEIGTFFEVFPNGVIWGNTHQGRGYDTVLMGTVDPPHFNVDEWEARINSPGYAAVKASLGEIGIDSAVTLFANYAGRASDMKAYLADAQINRDRDLRLQYLAGLGLESLSERTDLCRDPEAQEVPGGALQRISGNHGTSPRRDRRRPRWRTLEPAVLVVPAAIEEIGLDERSQQQLAASAIQIPQALSLLDAQTQPRHFDELGFHAVEQADGWAHGFRSPLESIATRIPSSDFFKIVVFRPISAILIVRRSFRFERVPTIVLIPQAQPTILSE